MPWTVHERDGKFCVVKEGESEPVPGGCHGTRAQAIKHQRALYSAESRTATIEPEISFTGLFGGNGQQNPVRVEIAPPSPEPMRVEIAAVHQELTEAVIASLAAVTERLVQTEETMVKVVEAVERLAQEREGLTAAIGEMSMPAPVVNVTVPEPVVNITVPTPSVHMEMPASRKEVRFQRDFSGRVEGAVIEEAESDG